MKKILLALTAFLLFTGCEMQVVPTEPEGSLAENKIDNYALERVIDGDTIIFRGLKKSVRLVGIDTPESKASLKLIDMANQCTDGSLSAMKILGKEASHFVEGLTQVGRVYEVKSIETGKYGRVIGDITVNGESLSLQIAREGYATIYPGKSKISPDLKDRIESAYLDARANSKGLWGKYPIVMECLNPR